MEPLDANDVDFDDLIDGPILGVIRHLSIGRKVTTEKPKHRQEKTSS